MRRTLNEPRHFLFKTLLLLIVCVVAAFSDGAAADAPATKELTNSVGMKFTMIPAGEFLMGAGPEEIAERRAQLIKRGGEEEAGEELKKEEIALVESEAPQHRVKISKEFLLGTYEVTQQDFQAVMGFNPSVHSATGSRKDWLTGLDTRRHPVDQVSWNDAVEFCRLLSSLDGEVAAGRSYRLPTEAEWEYACRAGTTTKFFWGDDKGKKADDWMNYPKIGTGKRAVTVPVGSLKTNPWGLYDMSGNAREWCSDWYDAKTYAQGEATDPAGAKQGNERVVRGGMNFRFPPGYRSAVRNKYAPDAANMHIGFRVVCVQGPIPKYVPAVAAAATIDAQLKQKGLVRSGLLYVLAEESEFIRYTTTLERMRVTCFNALREVDDAKKQLQRLAGAQAGALQARIEARNIMRYSDTWREHRFGVISRNQAADVLALVNLSREDTEYWLKDAQADYEATVKRFAEQCKALRAKHERMQIKQREMAADSAVLKALATVSDESKSSYRVGASLNANASLKKLEYEESVLKKLQAP